jgi:hypothetical protein
MLRYGTQTETRELDFTAVKLVNLYDLISAETRLEGGPSEFYGQCPLPGCSSRDDALHVRETADGWQWFCRRCHNDSTHPGRFWFDALDFIMHREGITSKADALARLGLDKPVDPAVREQQQADLARRRTEREQESLLLKTDALEKASTLWPQFYQNLDKYPQGRVIWHTRGLRDEWIDYFKVGYNPVFLHSQGTTDALTIPFFKPHIAQPDGTLTWEFTGMTQRLLGKDIPAGHKYHSFKHMGKDLFRCDLYAPICGNVLVVEGPIKGMVTWANLQDWGWENRRSRSILRNLQVVATDGKYFKEEWIPEFDQAERIWILRDPDAYTDSVRQAKLLGVERCEILTLAGKIDDMLNAGQLALEDLEDLLFTARRVK